LPARQGLHRPQGQRQQIELAQQFQHALFRVVSVGVIQVQNDGQIAQHGLVPEQKRKIGQHKKALAQIQPVAAECLIVEVDVACIGRGNASEAAQQRGFPRAIRPEQTDDLTGRDFQGDAPQRVDGPIRFADCAQFNFHGPELK